MWHLRRITTTPANIVRAQRHALWYSTCDSHGMPHICPCGISGESQLQNQVYSSKIDLTLPRIHARNLIRGRRALRRQDAGTGTLLQEWRSRFSKKMPKTCHGIACRTHVFCPVVYFVKRFSFWEALTN